MEVWKYVIPSDEKFEVSMPRGSRVLTVQQQRQNYCMWFLCDPKNLREIRKFSLYHTGVPIAEDIGEYIGTFQVHNGATVLHLFEDSKCLR